MRRNPSKAVGWWVAAQKDAPPPTLREMERHKTIFSIISANEVTRSFTGIVLKRTPSDRRRERTLVHPVGTLSVHLPKGQRFIP